VAWAVRFVIEKQWVSASREYWRWLKTGLLAGLSDARWGSPSSRSRPAVLVVKVACLTHGRVAEPREAVVARPAPLRFSRKAQVPPQVAALPVDVRMRSELSLTRHR
jgi:hypothetical protein